MILIYYRTMISGVLGAKGHAGFSVSTVVSHCGRPIRGFHRLGEVPLWVSAKGHSLRGACWAPLFLNAPLMACAYRGMYICRLNTYHLPLPFRKTPRIAILDRTLNPCSRCTGAIFPEH